MASGRPKGRAYLNVSASGFSFGLCFANAIVLWIGVDDTDSLTGMCTTFLAGELVRELTRAYDLIGYPRLVRLNPNIAWKTRGSGAVCIRVGSGEGRPEVVGELAGRPIRSFPRARGHDDLTDAHEIVARLVERWSEFQDATTNPGFSILPRAPRASLCWKAVRTIVTKEEALRAITAPGIVREYKNGRGIIGALAASSWRPRDRTYEVIAYRARSRWGTPRAIVPASVRALNDKFPSTFNNFDYASNRVVIAPHSPCPILFGIRGDDPGVLPAAMRTVLGETPAGWIVFETNQGTDDHVLPSPTFQPRTTVRVDRKVTVLPRTIRGGHVIVAMEGLQATAYEPSKGFRDIVRALRPGDRVRLIGSMRDVPRTLNIEKLRLLSRAEEYRKLSNPLCPGCRKRAKSMGRQAGFRCARCGQRFPASAATMERVSRPLKLGWYEPPVGSRRHLSKPLSRRLGLSERPAAA